MPFVIEESGAPTVTAKLAARLSVTVQSVLATLPPSSVTAPHPLTRTTHSAFPSPLRVNRLSSLVFSVFVSACAVRRAILPLVSTDDIFPPGDRLKMIGVNAVKACASVRSNMVELHPFRNRANQLLINKTVGEAGFTVSIKHPVSVRVMSPRPKPASLRFLDVTPHPNVNRNPGFSSVRAIRCSQRAILSISDAFPQIAGLILTIQAVILLSIHRSYFTKLEVCLEG